MAQADYVISPNPTGLAMRTEVNQIFQAILTNNSGSVAPTTTQAGMLWGDISNASTYYLKIRNHTNDGWVSLYAYDVATKTINATSALTLSGLTPTIAELNYVDGVTSAIQTQLNAKAPLASPTFTGTVVLPSTTSIGNVSNTEIGYLDGVTSAIQTQLNAKAPLASPALTGTPTAPTASAGTNTTQIATTAFVKAKSEADSIGVNQTWQVAELTNTGATFTDGTAKYRTLGVTYTNTTGKPISVMLNKSLVGGTQGNFYINGLLVAYWGYSAGSSISAHTIQIIPHGATYSASSLAPDTWFELR